MPWVQRDLPVAKSQTARECGPGIWVPAAALYNLGGVSDLFHEPEILKPLVEHSVLAPWHVILGEKAASWDEERKISLATFSLTYFNHLYHWFRVFRLKLITPFQCSTIREFVFWSLLKWWNQGPAGNSIKVPRDPCRSTPDWGSPSPSNGCTVYPCLMVLCACKVFEIYIAEVSADVVFIHI